MRKKASVASFFCRAFQEVGVWYGRKRRPAGRCAGRGILQARPFLPPSFSQPPPSGSSHSLRAVTFSQENIDRLHKTRTGDDVCTVT